MAQRVVIVDDDVHTRRVLGLHLTRHGYAVETVGDTAGAIAALERTPADLVLTDILMRPPDGLDLIDHTRRHYPHTPVIAMTGGDIDLITDATERGAMAALTKPFPLHELIETVERAIGGPSYVSG